MSALIPLSDVVRLDAELVRIARGESASRLAIGTALDALSACGGHHELGFSSFEAYARERCERTGRWAADTRWLAERLRALPRIREALCTGVLGWSTAELLARYVSPESELEWLERARCATVRELRALLRAQAGTDAKHEAGEAEEAEESEAPRTLTVSATREDGWLFECARKVAETVAGPMPADRLLQTLLAEGYSSLLELAPEDAIGDLCDIDELERDAAAESQAQAEWCAERRRWRDEAEELCKDRWSPFAEGQRLQATLAARERRSVVEKHPSSPPRTPPALDREIRRLCTELAERDLALGILAERAKKAEVWRRLGFVSEAQYARERVGVSLSSLKSKRILAGRTKRLPELASALSSGRLGYEAAYQLSRIATPSTVREWIRRAEQRTVKHLREEVEAAELMIRMSRRRHQSPFEEQELERLFELERSIVSGELLDSAGNGMDNEWAAAFRRDGARSASAAAPKTNADDERAQRWHAGQISGSRRAALRRYGRIRLRFVVRESTARFYRSLERAFVRVRARAGRLPWSFLRFLCENFCVVWLPVLRRERFTESGVLLEYFGVYRRDAFRCSSPVCTRRDVTPHHLLFRSRGGGDEDENLATLCVWCHLRGVHEGRIAAEPPASRIQWRIGRSATLRVEGRRVRAR
jgi:hypothetical protein